MAKGTMDRRVSRTRSALNQALLSLIQERGYETISIKDICDAANVGRSTFYAHFTSKDDLKRNGLEHLRRLLVEEHRKALATPDRAKRRRFAFSLTMFEHARDHMDLYRALAGGRGGVVALDAIRQILSSLVRDELAAIADKKSADAIPRALSVQFIVGAYMTVLTWWLDGGAKLPPQKIDAMFLRLATKGVGP